MIRRLWKVKCFRQNSRLLSQADLPYNTRIRAGVAWLDLRQTHSIKAYVGKFQGIVSTSNMCQITINS